MGTIFILAGSLIGFVAAVVSVAVMGAPLLAGLALWIVSGPLSALAYIGLVLPLGRLLGSPEAPQPQPLA